jgi:hypothetical protein
LLIKILSAMVLNRTTSDTWSKHQQRFLLRTTSDYILSIMILSQNRYDITMTIYTTSSQA